MLCIFTTLCTLRYDYFDSMLLYEITLALEFFRQWVHTSSLFKFRNLDPHEISVWTIQKWRHELGCSAAVNYSELHNFPSGASPKSPYWPN
jgi:hypothetical protein